MGIEGGRDVKVMREGGLRERGKGGQGEGRGMEERVEWMGSGKGVGGGWWGRLWGGGRGGEVWGRVGEGWGGG